MPKYILFPFAENGDRQPVPDSPVTTEVSYELGYTPEYELEKSNPDRRNVGRQPFNGILHDATENIKQWQDQAFPDIYSDDGTGSMPAYPKGFVGVSGGIEYQCVADAGATTMPPSSDWIEWSPEVDYRERLTGGGPLTGNKHFHLADSLTYTLPDVSGLSVGASVVVTKAIPESPTVDTFGAEQISTKSGLVASLAVEDDTEIVLIWVGPNWELAAGDAAAGFDQDFSDNGYQVLPSGLIIQWGSGVSTSGLLSVTFPIAFPNQCIQAYATDFAAGFSAMDVISVGEPTSVGVDVLNRNYDTGAQTSNPVNWLAIGH